MLVASTELARQDGDDKRIVVLSLTPGGIELSAQDLGPLARTHWGGSDYEFGVKLATADLPKIAYALIEKHYRNRLGAVDELRDLASKAGIDANFWSFA